ncbi:MAG: hypothetical protein KZQ75_08040 [Candidatus Thiodiazotropha sp. (ex Myrtea spinifera)]|nr:hypothetical protein [Candidatus Thiodiazotropha sp. (ex Myrtea spinifera)]
MKQVIILIFMWAPGFSWACSCVETSDETAYANSKSVMLVKITDTKLVPSKEKGEVVQAKFNVIETFKGTTGELELLQSTVEWTCSTALISGHKYLIYSNGEKTKKISACTKSRWINETREAELLEKYRSKK